MKQIETHEACEAGKHCAECNAEFELANLRALAPEVAREEDGDSDAITGLLIGRGGVPMQWAGVRLGGVWL